MEPDFPEIHRLKAEASFVADDPWNANHQATFSLDQYVYTTMGVTVRPNSRPPGIYRHGIRSEPGGVAQDLPDALYFAWRAGRIKPEALPRLLHELQPTLKRGKWGDYGIELSDRAFTVVVWIAVVWLVLAFAAWVAFFIAIWPSGPAMLIALPFAVGIPIVAGRIFYLGVYQIWQRRKAQTKWILARAGA
jgi:hypothetical protein